MIDVFIPLDTKCDLRIPAGSKIAVFCNIIVDQCAYKYEIRLHSGTVIDVLKAKSLPPVICPLTNSPLKGRDWETLSISEITAINEGVIPQLSPVINGYIRFGLLARYVYKNIIADVREALGYWAVFEGLFEVLYKDESAIDVLEDHCIDNVLLVNDSNVPVTYSISLGDDIYTGEVSPKSSLEPIPEEVDLSLYRNVSISSDCSSSVLTKVAHV